MLGILKKNRENVAVKRNGSSALINASSKKFSLQNRSKDYYLPHR